MHSTFNFSWNPLKIIEMFESYNTHSSKPLKDHPHAFHIKRNQKKNATLIVHRIYSTQLNT